MAEFIVTDPVTGRKLRLTGDSPPTEQELEQIFAAQAPAAAPQAQPGESPSALSQITGALPTVISGALAEPISGLAGIAGLIAGAVVPGGETGAEKAKRFVQGTQAALTIDPTKAGQEGLQAVGEAIAPAVEKFEQAGEFLGSTALEATGSPAFAAFARTLPTAALEAIPGGLALRSARRAGKPGKQLALPSPEDVAKQADDIVKGGNIITRAFTGRQSPTKQKIAQLIQEGSTDVETAKFQLVESVGKGAGKIEADTLARQTIRQGFDPGVIAAVKGASDFDKARMLDMVDIMEKGKKNRRFSLENRPSDVAGRTLVDRFQTVNKANRDAGKRLDGVAERLKGQPVNIDSAVTQFADALDDLGIGVTRGEPPNFAGSIIEGATGAESLITKLVKRMDIDRPLDAFEVHRMKKFIDEQVTFGKSAEGLSGKTEFAVKSFRRNLDQALDQTFPAYNEVNTIFAETIDALDSLQDVAGRKMNLRGPNADKAVGTLTRRLLSNAQSRVTLLDAANKLESIAIKHGDEAVQGDLLNQILFVDELDRVFGPIARTSFQGQITQGVEAAARGKAGIIDETLRAGGRKVKALAVNDEKAFKTMRALLKRK